MSVERVDPVGAVAAVPLGQPGAGEAFWNGGQDPVADVLVRRHAAGEGLAPHHHPASEDGVGVPATRPADQLARSPPGRTGRRRGGAPRCRARGRWPSAYPTFWLPPYPRLSSCRTTVIGRRDDSLTRAPTCVGVVGARVVTDHHVVDGAANDSGRRSRVWARVLAALYATTRTPTRGSATCSRCEHSSPRRRRRAPLMPPCSRLEQECSHDTRRPIGCRRGCVASCRP